MSTRKAATGSKALILLCLGALGVVFGDISTSPLYAFQQCFGIHGVTPTHENILGVLSLIFWALTLTISIKYLVFVMRADNHGEGGILALLAKIPSAIRNGPRGWILGLVAIFGAALLYGDGMITPAISVLSAVEGLHVATSFFDPYIIPITLAILFALFAIQRRGTEGIGAVFGPVMIIWVLTLAGLGLVWILRAPVVLTALDPIHALRFFVRNGRLGFIVLGSVFLVETGGEALYADMGHFGRRPIRLTWFTMVLPALLLNYFGQGALLWSMPHARSNPFYELLRQLGGGWLLYPLVILATLATIIASQAIISGAFSLTRQTVQLGYAPRIEIRHTSADHEGQIYVPAVNWLLMAATFALVLGFRESAALAWAYGIAVTLTMTITTILGCVVAVTVWRWRLPLVLAGGAVFLAIDLAFLGANVLKIANGGWVPLTVGALICLLLTTWRAGRTLVDASIQGRGALPLAEFVHSLTADIRRVPGCAVFLSRTSEVTPTSLLHNLKHNKVLHAQNLVVSITAASIPFVADKDRLVVEDLGAGFFRVEAKFGFLESPRMAKVIHLLNRRGFEINEAGMSFFLSRETLLRGVRSRMSRWRFKLFALLHRNAQSPTRYFRLPVGRVVEMGIQVTI